jgi:hypothetical protein
MPPEIAEQSEKAFQLAVLIDRELGIRARDLSLHQSLFHDLGVAGVDGSEFMEMFAKEFSVNLEKFHPREYFGDDLPFNPASYLWKWASGASPNSEIKRLEVIDLIRLIELGHWPLEALEN